MATADAPFKPKLYSLTWGHYARRVTVYLREKGIESEIEFVNSLAHFYPGGVVPGKPPGSVPILEYAPGKYIRQSRAILEYFEDIYPTTGPSLRGATPLAAARTRELMDLIGEAADFWVHFEHNGSALFVESHKPQSAEASGQALRRSNWLLDKVEAIADPEGPYLAETGDQPGLADIVLLALVQFGREVCGWDVLEGHERLRKTIVAFEKRESANWDSWPERPGFLEIVKTMTVKKLWEESQE